MLQIYEIYQNFNNEMSNNFKKPPPKKKHKKKPHTVIYDTVFVQNVSKSFWLGTVYVHKDYGDY